MDSEKYHSLHQCIELQWDLRDASASKNLKYVSGDLAIHKWASFPLVRDFPGCRMTIGRWLWWRIPKCWLTAWCRHRWGWCYRQASWWGSQKSSRASCWCYRSGEKSCWCYHLTLGWSAHIGCHGQGHAVTIIIGEISNLKIGHYSALVKFMTLTFLSNKLGTGNADERPNWPWQFFLEPFEISHKSCCLGLQKKSNFYENSSDVAGETNRSVNFENKQGQNFSGETCFSRRAKAKHT